MTVVLGLGRTTWIVVTTLKCKLQGGGEAILSKFQSLTKNIYGT